MFLYFVRTLWDQCQHQHRPHLFSQQGQHQHQPHLFTQQDFGMENVGFFFSPLQWPLGLCICHTQPDHELGALKATNRQAQTECIYKPFQASGHVMHIRWAPTQLKRIPMWPQFSIWEKDVTITAIDLGAHVWNSGWKERNCMVVFFLRKAGNLWLYRWKGITLLSLQDVRPQP